MTLFQKPIGDQEEGTEGPEGQVSVNLNEEQQEQPGDNPRIKISSIMRPEKLKKSESKTKASEKHRETKKPPMEIVEVEEEDEEGGEGEDGEEEYKGEPLGVTSKPLSYMDNSKSFKSQKDKRNSRGGMVPILLGIIVSVGLAAFMMFQLAPTKAQFNEQQARIDTLEASITSIQETVIGMDGILTNVVNTMGEYAKKPYVDGQFTNLGNDILVLREGTNTILGRLTDILEELD